LRAGERDGRESVPAKGCVIVPGNVIVVEGDLVVGLSNLQVAESSIDLGQGIVLRKTYAHMAASFLMAFKPAPRGGYNPGPWKSAAGGFAFDVTAELLVPANLGDDPGGRFRIAKTIVFLLRLWVDPACTAPVLSNHPFGDLPKIADKETKLLPFEVLPRYFPLSNREGVATEAKIGWVRANWEITDLLIVESTEFALAVEALSTGQFVSKTALTLIFLWAAIEALFSPSTSELKFRVSSLVAAYLEPPGDARAGLQRHVASLYDLRSAAAHGKPRHEQDHLLGSFDLLRRILTKMIEKQKVPSKDDLERTLFGAGQADVPGS